MIWRCPDVDMHVGSQIKLQSSQFEGLRDLQVEGVEICLKA